LLAVINDAVSAGFQNGASRTASTAIDAGFIAVLDVIGARGGTRAGGTVSATVDSGFAAVFTAIITRRKHITGGARSPAIDVIFGTIFDGVVARRHQTNHQFCIEFFVISALGVFFDTGRAHARETSGTGGRTGRGCSGLLLAVITTTNGHNGRHGQNYAPKSHIILVANSCPLGLPNRRESLN